MLFDSSIRKELARSFGATLVVLVTVVMTMMLIRTLGQAARGSVSPSDVMLVMGYTVLGQLSTILSLSLPHGGHLTHGWKVTISGRFFNVFQYGVRPDDHRIYPVGFHRPSR